MLSLYSIQQPSSRYLLCLLSRADGILYLREGRQFLPDCRTSERHFVLSLWLGHCLGLDTETDPDFDSELMWVTTWIWLWTYLSRQVASGAYKLLVGPSSLHQLVVSEAFPSGILSWKYVGCSCSGHRTLCRMLLKRCLKISPVLLESRVLSDEIRWRSTSSSQHACVWRNRIQTTRSKSRKAIEGLSLRLAWQLVLVILSLADSN